MKIPDQMKIGGHIFTIDCSKELVNMEGECDSKTNTIRICSTLSQSQKEATLIHEILHALNSVMGDEIIWHVFLDGLSNQLYALLKDNNLLKD